MAGSSASALSSRPLYNTTYHIYRLSPLHLPNQISSSSFPSTLSTHSRRLTEHLQRDAQLGLSVPGLGGLSDDNETLARAGQLRGTKLQWLSGEGSATTPDEDDEGTEEIEKRGGADGYSLLEGLSVTIEFEKAVYTALLLRRTQSSTSTARDERRLILPLALLRMPTPLRSALFSYLAAHFDARADSVRVPEQTIAGSLESYLAAVSGDDGEDGEDGNESPRPSKITKDIQLTLAFPGPEVRSLDVTIAADDVAGFVRRGRGSRPSLNQYSSISSNPTSFATGPFTTSLSTYLTTHLALDCTHASIELSRVACGGFALGREGRVKVFAPPASASASGDGEGGTGNEVVEGLVDALWGIVGAELEPGENDEDE